jgi:hypothetical protein
VVIPVSAYLMTCERPVSLASARALETTVGFAGTSVAHVEHVGYAGVSGLMRVLSVQQLLQQSQWAQVRGTTLSLGTDGPDTDAAKDNPTAPKPASKPIFSARRGVPPRGRPV